MVVSPETLSDSDRNQELSLVFIELFAECGCTSLTWRDFTQGMLPDTPTAWQMRMGANCNGGRVTDLFLFYKKLVNGEVDNNNDLLTILVQHFAFTLRLTLPVELAIEILNPRSTVSYEQVRTYVEQGETGGPVISRELVDMAWWWVKATRLIIHSCYSDLEWQQTAALTSWF